MVNWSASFFMRDRFYHALLTYCVKTKSVAHDSPIVRVQGLQVHRIKSRSQLSDDLEFNLISPCTGCNQRVHRIERNIGEIDRHQLQKAGVAS